MKKKRKKAKINWERIIWSIVFATLLVSTVYVTIMIFIAEPGSGAGNQEVRVKSDYVLSLLQCLIGLFALLLPAILERKTLIIPHRMMILYALFLYAAIFLGEVRNFYFEVPHWDVVLHAFSGGMTGALGFSLIVILNKTNRVPINLSPLFIAVFAFCFSVTLGVFWEIYEFSFDGLLGLNMQKFRLEDGTQLIARSALMDTMKDLIVDCAGAFVISAIGYISLKYKKGWVERLLVKKKKRTA